MKKFWSQVEKSDWCWEWSGKKNRHGYGQYNGVGAHRVAWELENGPIPEGMWVLHHCDNPACVNPGHLYIGTRQDNVNDMVKRGRSGGGKLKNKYEKGTPAEIVINILGVRPLARSLKIVPSTILRWREREGRIPSQYHKDIIELGAGEITPEDLIYGR